MKVLLLLLLTTPICFAQTEKTANATYCDAMVTSFSEVVKSKGVSTKDIRPAANIVAADCRKHPKKTMIHPISEYSLSYRKFIECLGGFQGMYYAHTLGKPQESDAKIESRRIHAGGACEGKRAEFESDLFNFGPDYVFKRDYK